MNDSTMKTEHISSSTMLATPLIFLLRGARTWATPLQKRDSATVLDLAVDVEYAKTDLEEDLNQAINDVVASSTFATASSTRVTNSVTGLKPHILAILDKLVDNKPGFTSAGVISIVKADLQSLQNLTNVYSTDIQAKVTTAGKATISSVVVEVNAAYFSTTTAFY
ncbi:hypothetical protein AnigIFM63326_006089 [Aspergillus niger]|nr:hypothetical protein AnigIFM63326_006089 [Aspergillus niger]